LYVAILKALQQIGDCQRAKSTASATIVGMIKGILYRGEGSHQDMNIACALAYHEFVTGNKFELVDGGEVDGGGGVTARINRIAIKKPLSANGKLNAKGLKLTIDNQYKSYQ
jgi:hypothetical protein